MIPRDTFINKLRSLGYVYKRRQKRTDQWRKSGGTHMIFVPLRQLLAERYVRSALNQAGCTVEEIEKFVATYRQ